jgi:hypothetical protein
VAQAHSALKEHWATLASFAFHVKGLTIDLTRVPPYAIDWVLEEMGKLQEEASKK